MGNSPSKHLVIPSRLDQIVPVQNQVIDEIKAAGFSSQAVFAVQLALDEALANAVKHGNKLDPDKNVTIVYSVTDERLEITITDEGPGFNPDELADPTLEENLSRPNGRGVMLMRAYMTEVSFNELGNRVRLVKTKDCKLPTTD